MELNESRDQPLRMKAYLKLKVNPRKGVISWNEVTEKEVPEKALENYKENRWQATNGFSL